MVQRPPTSGRPEELRGEDGRDRWTMLVISSRRSEHQKGTVQLSDVVLHLTRGSESTHILFKHRRGLAQGPDQLQGYSTLRSWQAGCGMAAFRRVKGKRADVSAPACHRYRVAPASQPHIPSRHYHLTSAAGPPCAHRHLLLYTLLRLI